MKKLFAIILLPALMIACSGSDAEETTTDEIVKISTEFGDIYLALYDETPVHKENFLKLANEGFYDSTTFHRVIEGFMVQGGDPNSKDSIAVNDGQGGPGYTLEAEFNTNFIHKRGALAAARLGDQQNPERESSGSQFYIVHGREVNDAELDQIEDRINNMTEEQLIREYVEAPDNADLLNEILHYQKEQNIDSLQVIFDRIAPVALAGFERWEYSPEQRSAYQTIGGAPFLDQNYTIFGEVIEGMAVVDSIVVVNKDQRNRPLEDISMSVTVQTMDKSEVSSKFGYTYQ